MVHVALGLFRRQGVQLLRVAGRAQRCNGQHLGFAACEEAGAVDTGQDADVAADGPDFGCLAAIRANALVEDLLAHGVFQVAFVRRLKIGRVEAFFEPFSHLDA